MKNERCYYSLKVDEAMDKVRDSNVEYCKQKEGGEKNPVEV